MWLYLPNLIVFQCPSAAMIKPRGIGAAQMAQLQAGREKEMEEEQERKRKVSPAEMIEEANKRMREMMGDQAPPAAQAEEEYTPAPVLSKEEMVANMRAQMMTMMGGRAAAEEAAPAAQPVALDKTPEEMIADANAKMMHMMGARQEQSADEMLLQQLLAETGEAPEQLTGAAVNLKMLGVLNSMKSGVGGGGGKGGKARKGGKGEASWFSGAAGGKGGAVAVGGPWSCPACGANVFGHLSQCLQCGTERPTFASLAGMAAGSSGSAATPRAFKRSTICRNWQSGHCPRGDNCNFAHGEEQLGTFQPVATTCSSDVVANRASMGLATWAGDWTCPGCGDLVFGSKPTCRKCGAPKPADLSQGSAGSEARKMGAQMAAMMGRGQGQAQAQQYQLGAKFGYEEPAAQVDDVWANAANAMHMMSAAGYQQPTGW